MTLVPFTGWRCLGCGLMTDRGFPPIGCCPGALPMRVLVDLPDPPSDIHHALREVRAGEIAVEEALA